jgi:predicted phage tail protein
VDSGDINANLLRFVTEGSAYRIQRQNADDQIYKILEMREEAPNEYAVVATKYDSGKFDLIENSVSVEFQSDTFGYGVNNQINDVNYVTLDTPVIDSITTGDGSEEGYYISGDWQPVSNATGYNVILRSPSLIDTQSINTSETGFSFDNNTEIGYYTFSVNALGDSSNNAGTRYYDSSYTVSGISILPTNSDLYETPNAAVNNITTQ